MSLIDFSQESKHQGCLHIAVTALGDASASLFNAVTKELCSLPPIQLAEPKGTVLFLRFLNYAELPSWALGGPKWDEFSPHKQILGVLGISQCLDVDDLDNVMAGFKSNCAQFKSSLCDSRCIIYGSKSELGQYVDPRKGYCLVDCSSELESYSTGDVCVEDLTEIVTDFALAIYITLKSRIAQLEKSYAVPVGRVDSLKLLKSPFESKEFNRPDEDGAADARPPTSAHVKARMEKHIADMYLLTGDLQKAFTRYNSSLTMLKPHQQRDSLWYAAVNEGLGVTTIIMKLCEEVLGQKAQGYPSSLSGKKLSLRGSTNSSSPSGVPHTRSSLTMDSRRRGLDRPSLSNDTPAKKYATVSRHMVSISKDSGQSSSSYSGDGEESTDGQNGGLVMRGVGSQIRQDSMSNYIDSDDDGSGGEVDGILDNMDMEDEEDGEEQWLQVDKAVLQKDYIADKYSVALRFYAKARFYGAVSHLEALLKFAKYLVEQKRYAVAGDILQRMLKIDDPSFITDSDKLEVYCTMANVYSSMGFHRKAAMFTHYAARWASNIAQTPEQIFNAHYLISKCLPGYKLSEELSEMPRHSHMGWPLLQAQVLTDFVFLSRRRHEDVLAIRHSCYLLQHLSPQLTISELQEVCKQLEYIVEEATEEAHRNSTYASSMIGKLESPLPLLNFPCVKSVNIIPLMTQLAPIKIQGFVSSATSSASTNKGPFIFSPFEAKRQKEKQRPEVLWVVGNPGEISMIIENPLAFDLRVSKMSVLMKGSQVETFPTSLTLPSKSEPQDIKLLTVPSESGLLDVKGYEATVFGIRHECKVKIPGDPVVRVVPPLPEMRLRLFPVLLASSQSENAPLSPNRDGSFVRTDIKRSSKTTVTEFELLDGETCKCEFQMECLGEVNVEKVTLSVADYDKDFCSFSWEEETIESLVPLSKGRPKSIFVTALAKIPSWYRVLNEHTQGISKTTVFPNRIPSRHDSKHFTNDTSQLSHSANTTPTDTPTSSPISKHSRFGFARSSPKANGKRTSERNSDPDFSFPKETSLVDSLDLDHPSLNIARTSSTLPNIRRSPGHQRNPSLGSFGKRRNRGSAYKKASALEPIDIDLFDDKRASMVSTRSDPGDRGDAKNRFVARRTNKSTNPEIPSKSIHIPKTVEPRVSPLSTSPYIPSENSVASSYQPSQSVLSRVGSGGGKSSVGRRQHPTLTKGLISVPVGPLIREKPQAPSRTKITGEFKVQYMGGSGYLEGYCRECEASLPVVVKPCLVFEKFELTSVESSHQLFMLKFVVHNICKSRMDISITAEQDYDGGNDVPSLTLDPNGQKKVGLSVKRFVLTEHNSHVNKTDSELAKLYSEKVSEVIKIHWKDMERDKVGVVTLKGLRLPVSDIALVRSVPLVFGISVNSLALQVREAYLQERNLGDQIKLTVTLTNSSGVCMPPSFLSFEPYMYSQQQRRILKDLSHILLHSGNLVTSVPQLDPGNCYEHEITLVFLHKGSFHMDMKSCMLKSDSAKTVVNTKEQTTTSNNTAPVSDNITSTDSRTETETTKETDNSTTRDPVTHTQLTLTSTPEKEAESPDISLRVSTTTNSPSSQLTTKQSSVDHNGCISPPPVVLPKPTSPRRTSVKSPDATNKAILLAKQYEQGIAARAALVYTGGTVSPSRRKKTKDDSDQAAVGKESSMEAGVPSESVSQSQSRDSTSTHTSDNKNTIPTDTSKDSLPVTKQKSRIDPNTISTLLSEYIPGNSLLTSIAVFPQYGVTCSKYSPPIVPKDHHNNVNHTQKKLDKKSSGSMLDGCNQFRKLLKARSQNPKLVQVISGPQFTFNIT